MVYDQRQYIALESPPNMTILYKVQNSVTGLNQTSSLCNISPKNILAFTNYKDLEYCLYVCDIVTPWQNYTVKISPIEICILEWNHAGELLMVSYKNGLTEIWAMKHNCINTWLLIFTINLPNEGIVGAKFFHQGKGSYFSMPKKELSGYADKFERLVQNATLTGLGGTAVEGGFVLSNSGLMAAFVFPQPFIYNTEIGGGQSGSMPSLPHELRPSTYRIRRAFSVIAHHYISYCPMGYLNVAMIFSNESNVCCYKVKIECPTDGETLTIKCNAMPEIFLPYLRNFHRKIKSILWQTVNCEECVLIVYDYPEGSCIEQWNLSKKRQPVNKLLLKSNKNDFLQMESWETVAKVNFSYRLNDICTSKLPTETLMMFAILQDNSIHVLELGLKNLGSYMLERLSEEHRLNCKLLTADVTYLNQLLLMLDNFGQIYALQVHDKNYKLNPIALPLALLEYSIVTGIDASDVLMLNISNLELLAEKLTENFSRQPAHIRHFYYSNFLSLKSNMCRIQSKQQDFDNLIILHSISITLKGLLRPADLNSQDKGPAENLSMILTEPITEIDKVLCVLDPKDFTVEPMTLQSLQQLIQWVADLALSILNKLPEETMKAKFNKKHGYDISRDIVAISSIRELLVMIRIWGLLNPYCLPFYSKSVESFDILPVLFRLLTRLIQNPNDPDDNLLDECSTLSTQLIIPIKRSNTPTTLLNNHVGNKSLPLYLENGVIPLALQDNDFKNVLFNNNARDAVSNMYLGAYTKSLRQCIRCGFINNINKLTKTTALRAWYLRWQYCHCGGLWRNT